MTDQLMADGVEPVLARAVARCPYRLHLLDVLDIAEIADRDVDEVGELAFAVLEHFDIDVLLDHVNALQRGDRWQLLARLALRDDLYSLVRALTLAILSLSEPGEDAEAMIADWSSARSSALRRVRGTLEELIVEEQPEIAALTVAVRAVRSLV